MKLNGSETEKNLLTAFAGEAQARNRYSFFASQAKKRKFLKKMELFYGSAATAVMSVKGWTLPRNVQLVLIPKRTLNFYQKIGKI
jgi:hypothetical protein